jgi:hypothetical protein
MQFQPGSYSFARRARPPTRLRRHGKVPEQSVLARQHPFLRILPWRQRRRARSQSPNRLDRPRGQTHRAVRLPRSQASPGSGPTSRVGAVGIEQNALTFLRSYKQTKKRSGGHNGWFVGVEILIAHFFAHGLLPNPDPALLCTLRAVGSTPTTHLPRPNKLGDHSYRRLVFRPRGSDRTVFVSLVVGRQESSLQRFLFVSRV